MQKQSDKAAHARSTAEGSYMMGLQCLFALTEDQLRVFPGAIAYCEYLERCFQPLLADEFAFLWAALGEERPYKSVQCWPWFSAVCNAVWKLKYEDSSIEDVWECLKLFPNYRNAVKPSERQLHACHVAIFSVLCWATMTLQPRLSWVNLNSGSPCLMVHQQGSDQPGLKMDSVRRPIHAVFRQFHCTMLTNRWKHPVNESTTHGSTVLHVTSLNFASLSTIGKIRLQWVDNLTSHLDFDATNRCLSIFKFPSFCALNTLAAENSPPVPIFKGLLRALYGVNSSDAFNHSDNSVQSYQEVLMSYRLLFGQTYNSRKLVRAALKQLRDETDAEYDQLLDLVCGQSYDKAVRELPVSLWPIACRSYEGALQEEGTYSSQDDFPMFGQRLVKIQQFTLRQQPSRLRDLWRDRRNPLQWYTFWAELPNWRSQHANYILRNRAIASEATLTVWSINTREPHQFAFVRTGLQYLARDKLYEVEKPYSVEFEIDNSVSAKSTNHILATEPVTIYAIGPSDAFELDINGFCVIKAETNLNVQDALTRPETVESDYVNEIKAILHERFPDYDRIEAFEFVVCTVQLYFPHQYIYGTGQEDFFRGRDLDLINVWRPIVGPNDDWPLAICDYTSIDPENDVAVSDLLHPDRIGENQLLHPNKQHRWYYIEGQQTDDLLVFRNVDSTGKRAKAFHCAFFNPKSTSPPRLSCEVRFVGLR
ncbi:MAG: hypothetical protein M1822_005618 [Bathelium mastoideum]|nr:MAG: hypothetical protein M1822_005618 [Bathelium mastoideum]